MIDCRQISEMLEMAYLEGPDPTLPVEVQEHLESCANCQRESQELREVWMLLPASLETPEVSPELESALMQRIAGEKVVLADAESREDSRFNFLRYALAASVFVALGLSMLWTRQPSDPAENQLANTQRDHIEALAKQMETLQELERTFGSAQLQFASLQSVGTESEVRGTLVYDLQAGEGHFFGFNFDPEPDLIYKLWILDDQQEVVASSTIQIDAEAQRGSSLVKFPEDRTVMKEIIVTQEADESATTPSDRIQLRSPVKPNQL